jgi:hypothetical protein
MYRFTCVFALVLAVSVSACGDDPAPIDPGPTPVEVTEPFAGTLTVNGGHTHPFTVQQSGTVTVRVSALTPSDAVIGLSIGPLSAQGACTQSVANDAASSNTVLLGNASSGSFCARVFDSGRLTGPVDYEITVSHF